MNRELLKEYVECAKRETRLRRSVYPRLIDSGKMTQETADKEIKLMAGIAASLQKILNGNAPKEVQQALFDVNDYKKPYINNNNGAY